MKLRIHADDNGYLFNNLKVVIMYNLNDRSYTNNRIINTVLNCAVKDYISNGGTVDIDDDEIVLPLPKYRFLPHTGIYYPHPEIQQMINTIIHHCRDYDFDVVEAFVGYEEVNIYQLYDVYNEILSLIETLKNRDSNITKIHRGMDFINVLLDQCEDKPKGKFIAIEGCDCVGKDFVVDRLQIDKPHIITREPGGTDISHKIRDLLLDNKNKKMDVLTEILLYSASRAQHVKERIIPALESGINVITNRYYYSSFIYQSLRGVDRYTILKATEIAICGIIPDMTISLYSKDFDVIENRIRYKRNKDRLEHSNFELFKQINDKYYNLDINIPISNFESEYGGGNEIICIDTNREDKVDFINSLINGLID